MRIVSGTLRGRTVKAVPGKKTRPTLDKVKESVFNALGQYFTGGIGLDLYAGSGNLGIEAISRGLDSCVFIDRDFLAHQVIKDNIKTLNIESQCEIFKMDSFKALTMLSNKKYQFDYVFLDPPYQKQKINEVLTKLEDYDLLNDEATIIVECLKESELLVKYKGLQLEKEYIYGITKISIYKKCGDRIE
ncbi:16S rRNA (guanine(966)-N(2))-methyltransferase RsmD [Mycoplasmatota bacterium]|nr:16S rRNA (guanine(966)-N(2))-methyltransferase RsmD [Mycoplasmatota bacterium]